MRIFALRDSFPPQEQRIEVFKCFVTDTYYPSELETEIIQFVDQGRISVADDQRWKFVKNQIKPKQRTSFEVSNGVY